MPIILWLIVSQIARKIVFFLLLFPPPFLGFGTSNQTDKMPHLFRISSKFLNKSWSHLLDTPLCIIQSSYLWNNSLAFPSLLVQCTGFDRRRVWWPNTCCLKWSKNCSMGLMFGGFWMVLLPLDARNTICLELIGYFSQNKELIPTYSRSWFRNFVLIYISQFLFQTFLKISQSLLVFLEEAMKTCFVANLSSFQEKL